MFFTPVSTKATIHPDRIKPNNPGVSPYSMYSFCPRVSIYVALQSHHDCALSQVGPGVALDDRTQNPQQTKNSKQTIPL